MDNFMYSINATLPIFLIMILGKILLRFGIINQGFVKAANRYVYFIALPALVFKDLAFEDFSQIWDTRFVLFCFFTTLFVICLLWLLTELFMKKDFEKGAFIQGAYRSSAAILGMAFIANMYSDAGIAPLMIVGAVPLFNIFAVIILTLKGDNGGKKPDVKTTFLNVLKNPILISIFVGLAVSFFHIPIHFILQKSVSMLAGTASPLALIAIGAAFEGKKAIKKARPTILASFIKLLLLPALFMPIAVLLGFRNQALIAALIMLGSPSTPSGYVMVKNTNNNAVLSSSIIVLTTLLSSVTLTLWIYLFKTLGYL